MADWYYIRNGSSFDNDMYFSEICVDYFNRGNESDVSAFYHFYIGMAQKYYGEFETLYNSEDPREYIKTNMKVYVKIKYIEYVVMNISEFKEKNTLEQVKLKFQEKILSVEVAYKEKNDKLGRYIFDVFYFLSQMLCFRQIDPDEDNKSLKDIDVNIGIIANSTGWFAINSYLFAYINGVHLVGVPTLLSKFDGRTGCSRVFLEHDVSHIKEIIDGSEEYDITRQLYESIMLGEYNKQIKEILLFCLWFQLHETSVSMVIKVPIPKISIYPYGFFFIDNRATRVFSEVFDHIDSEVRKYILDHYEDIFGCLKRIGKDLGHLTKSERRYMRDSLFAMHRIYDTYNFDIIKEYIEKGNDNKPSLRFSILYLYGCYMLYGLIQKIKP